MVVLLMFLMTNLVSAIDQRAPEQIVEEASTTVLKTLNQGKERLHGDPTLINTLINLN